MKTENILAEIKSKSLKEARDEINEILTKLESHSSELNNYSHDYQRLIHDYRNNHNDIYYQSKGKSRMKNEPRIEDTVYVSCGKLKIMKCVVLTNFSTFDETIIDNYLKYDNNEQRPHTDKKIYLQLKIVEIYDDPEEFLGNQRTWTLIKN